MPDYLWLLPPMHVASIDGVITMLDLTNRASLSFAQRTNDIVAVLKMLDGEHTETEVRERPLGAELLDILAEQDLLVYLSRPLTKILEGRWWASRQLAYYAHLVRREPERTLDALAGSHVAIIGMGGIGSQAAQALAGAGVGALTIVDFDAIDDTNLNRQFMYSMVDIGRPKVDVAREFLLARHPHVRVTAVRANPFLAAPTPFEQADLIVFCGESHLTGPGKGLTTTKPVIQSGYIGPVGLVGPLRWPARGTACALCTIEALGKADYDEIYDNEIDLEASWNCSGSTINGLMGNLVCELAVRALAPWLGEGLSGDDVMRLDMRTMTLDRDRVPHVECAHGASNAA